MDTVYLETSIVSHASGWPSGDPEVAVLQDQAKRWLAHEAPKYNLVTSQFCVDEATRGDPDAAARRLALLADIPVLLPDARVIPRVYDLLEELGLPRLLICTPAEFLGDPNHGSKSNT